MEGLMSGIRTICIIAVCAALFAAPALAKNAKSNGHGAAPGKSSDQVVWSDDGAKPKAVKGDGKAAVFIGDDDEVVLTDYVKRHYQANCPPGLAKKNPPCIPPGQAKKLATGTVLKKGSYESLPVTVVERLTPPPPNGMYVRVDRNVYLIDRGTRKILDGIMLLSAVN
jgi:hypothetical protein